jgi:hypothetical protein
MEVAKNGVQWRAFLFDICNFIFSKTNSGISDMKIYRLLGVQQRLGARPAGFDNVVKADKQRGP